MEEKQTDDWSGACQYRANTFDTIALEVVKDDAPSGMCRPFLVRATDNRHYWIKLVRPGFELVPIVEQIVAGCGNLIGASMVETALVSIPEQMAGDVLSSGVVVVAGIAHGSLHVAKGHPKKYPWPHYRDKDSNRVRQASYYAMCQWCWCKDDHQWIYDLDDNYATYSHDHGHFLPRAPWTRATLEPLVHQSTQYGAYSRGLDANELERIANKLDTITKSDLVSILDRIPAAWPVTNEALEAIGWFLHARAKPSALLVRKLMQEV